MASDTKSHTENAEDVIEEELDLLRKANIERRTDRPIGLALSGGGIRSAAFSLGAMQALANTNWLKSIHYMSTVSGGGYIGSSLSWFGSRFKPIGDQRTVPDKSPNFDTRSSNFPFGSKEVALFPTYKDKKRQALKTGGDIDGHINRVNILDHLRQNGSYLQSRGGMGLLSLLAMVLRAMIPSFTIYFFMLLLPIACIAFILSLPSFSHRDLLLCEIGMADECGDEVKERIPTPILTPTLINISTDDAPTSSEDAEADWTLREWIANNGSWSLAFGLAVVWALAAISEAVFAGGRRFEAKKNGSNTILHWLIRQIRPAMLAVFATTVLALISWASSHPDKTEYVLYNGKFTAFLFIFILMIGVYTASFVNFYLSIFIAMSICFYNVSCNHAIISSVVTIVTFTLIYIEKKNMNVVFPIIFGSLIIWYILLLTMDIFDSYILNIPVWTIPTFLLFFCIFYLVATFMNFSEETSESRGDQPSEILADSYKDRTSAKHVEPWILVLIVALLILGFLPIMREVGEAELGATFTATGIAAYFGKMFKDLRLSDFKSPRMDNVITVTVSALLIFGLLLLAFAFCEFLWSTMHSKLVSEDMPKFVPAVIEYWGERTVLLVIVFVLMLIAIFIGSFINLNFVGMHRFYRDRLMETFLPNVSFDEKGFHLGSEETNAQKANEFFMHYLGSKHLKYLPYHIINTNVVLVQSTNPRYSGRGGANFILSPLYCGSDATGWRKSKEWVMPAGQITLPTAMAVSGAAINPRTGPGGFGSMRGPVLSFLMTFFNARLGLWVNNPRFDKRPAPNFLSPGFLQGLFGSGYNEHEQFLELTDGAHFDNSGLYELIRRRVKLIFLVDASEDKDFNFANLASALERIRADFAVQIRFGKYGLELQDLLHDPDKQHAFSKKLEFAERGFAVARIDYQPHEDNKPKDDEDGMLVIIKSTMIEELPADVLGYKSAHEDFPDETTVDQFFDEFQLEAYRELGYRIARAAIGDPKVAAEFTYCTEGYRPHH